MLSETSYDELEAELEKIDDKLDALQQGRLRAWKAFESNPSLGVTGNVDELQQRRNRVIEAMDLLENVSQRV